MVTTTAASRIEKHWDCTNKKRHRSLPASRWWKQVSGHNWFMHAKQWFNSHPKAESSPLFFHILFCINLWFSTKNLNCMLPVVQMEETLLAIGMSNDLYSYYYLVSWFYQSHSIVIQSPKNYHCHLLRQMIQVSCGYLFTWTSEERLSSPFTKFLLLLVLFFR